jgi:hypothetical protein
MELRVWVGCLACYNGGRLLGDWFDAEDAPQESDEWVTELRERFTDAERFAAELRWIAEHVAEGHEELWCFDNEGFAALGITGELSPVTAREVGEALSGLDDDDAAAFGAWFAEAASYTGPDAYGSAVADFREAYKGTYPHAWHYAFDLAGELYSAELKALPDELRLSIDWEQVAESMESNGWYVTTDLPNGGGTVVYTSE